MQIITIWTLGGLIIGLMGILGIGLIARIILSMTEIGFILWGTVLAGFVLGVLMDYCRVNEN